MKKFPLLLLLSMFFFVSCIQDEAPNAEADIVSCVLDGNVLKRPPLIENDKVTLVVSVGVNAANLAPQFELTPGATIEPPSGTARNFTFPQTYTVTSEDKKWKKTYTVTVQQDRSILSDYDFEGVSLVRVENPGSYPYHYHQIEEVDSQGSTTLVWASGNSGFVLAAKLDGLPDDPTVFPTCSWDEGRTCKCVKLVTCRPKASAAVALAPIAAGNLFTGKFVLENINKPAVCTHFGAGEVFPYRPISLEGYFKYKAGATMTVGTPEQHKHDTDMWDIYAVLYDATKATNSYLDGYNILSDPSIVLLAHLPREERHEADDWTHFFIEFQPFEGGTAFDEAKMKNGDYNLAIVMSSSEEGAYFNGAEGSTLYVDDVKLHYEEEEGNQ